MVQVGLTLKVEMKGREKQHTSDAENRYRPNENKEYRTHEQPYDTSATLQDKIHAERTFHQRRSQSTEKITSTELEVEPCIAAERSCKTMLETIPARKNKGNQFFVAKRGRKD